ncbi:hypothetical protein Ctob_005313 [Chrysochromulina tobinii]|uniref:Uncharacterized protein n=1 Tax=Chrysochromulina tobinii TaxID=1460289 RepID=A0A0M0J4J7_9EUKA|nr:hypothetical protein Ctob_005313 [Chrysochromulina tobinii]|eukprot:KOO21405.1 hypothetical protein Ctob_005313 [Chrysochromulina sp. CCMP291]
MLANMVIVATGYTLSMGAAPLMHSPARACAPLMADVVSENPWNDPREGKPFGEADGPNRPIGKVRGAVASYQPRGITDASVIKPQYIETDDEPWHSTSKQTVVATKKLLEKADLPFVAAETGLDRDLSAVTDASGVKAAMDKAVKAGARPGCAALKTGELLVTLFAKDAEAAMKKRPAAPKKTVQGAGWDGAERELAKVHDNSV